MPLSMAIIGGHKKAKNHTVGDHDMALTYYELGFS